MKISHPGCLQEQYLKDSFLCKNRNTQVIFRLVPDMGQSNLYSLFESVQKLSLYAIPKEFKWTHNISIPSFENNFIISI